MNYARLILSKKRELHFKDGKSKRFGSEQSIFFFLCQVAKLNLDGFFSNFTLVYSY